MSGSGWHSVCGAANRCTFAIELTRDANWRPCSWGTLGAPPHRTRDHVRRAVLGAPQLTHLAAIRVESNAVRVPAHAGPIPAAWRREEQVVTVAWPELLARFLGDAGFGDDSGAVLYDSPEGQNAAMLAWILEYLGRSDVYLMGSFFEAWKAEGREVLYKPLQPFLKNFTARPDRSVRATLSCAMAGRCRAGKGPAKSGPPGYGLSWQSGRAWSPSRRVRARISVAS